MNLPEIPEALIVRRNAHGFSHSFTVLQMDAYGRACALAAREDAIKEAAAICDGEKWCDTGKKSVDYIKAFNDGCDDCISVIGRMK